MTTYDALLRRLKEAKFQCIDGNMEETATDFDDAIFAITQLQRDNAALMEDAAAQIEIAREAVERAAGLERDAARYRWLRRQAISARYYASGNPNWEIDWALRGESFEAAVDAAMKTTET